MKSLKSGLFALLMLCSMVVMAQDGKSERPSRKERKEQMKANKEKLGLTKEQEARLKDLRSKHKSQIDEIQKSNASKSDKMLKIKDLRTQHEGEIKSILSPDQYNIFLENQYDRLENRKNNRPKKENKG